MARDTYAMANQARIHEMGYDQNENDGWEAEVSYDGVIEEDGYEIVE
jgi:hypothetical protein